MKLKQTGLKYKFVGFSIAAIVFSAVIGSLSLHYLILINQKYSLFYVVAVALLFSVLGVRHLKQNIGAITKSKEEAEAYSKELAESKKRLEAIFNGIPDGIMIIDNKFRLVTANPVMLQLLGSGDADIRGELCYELCNGTSKRCDFCKSDIVLKTGEHVMSYCTKTLEGQGEKIIEIHAFPLYSENGEINQIIEYAKDVTEAVKMQKSLESAKRLAAVGEMAAKVAHEVRNPLSAIQGAAHYLRKTNISDSEGYLRLIEEQVQRVNKVTTDLLVLSKPLQANLHPGSLVQAIDRALIISLPQIVEKQIVVKKEISDCLPLVPMDEAQIEQVFVNLILNAVDAMEQNGQMYISAKTNGVEKNGNHPEIEMKLNDNGCGIPKKNLNNLFQPFFTTKTKGTGLGLTIVKKIVDNHFGTIDIRSRPGKGTVVVLNFPTEIQNHEKQIHNFSN